jgi:hypothetical protein
MTTTLSDMTARKPKPSTEELAAKELVRLATEQGLSLTGPVGLLKQLTTNVLETALNEKMTEHIGHERNRVPEGRESTKLAQRHATQDSADPGRRPGRPRGPAGSRRRVCAVRPVPRDLSALWVGESYA